MTAPAPSQWDAQEPQPSRAASSWDEAKPDDGYGEAAAMMALAQAMGGIAGLAQCRADSLAEQWEAARTRQYQEEQGDER